MIEIVPAATSDSQRIATIARPIWQQHYTPIIGAQQVDYMLNKFQSEGAISQQIEQGYEYFLVTVNGKDAGYLATESRSPSLFISKFYLDEEFRGKGVARVMLDSVMDLARKQSLTQLELTVNKFNPAYQVYLKLGFENIESIQIDIGQGYIMDDYRMVLVLDEARSPKDC